MKGIYSALLTFGIPIILGSCHGYKSGQEKPAEAAETPNTELITFHTYAPHVLSSKRGRSACDENVDIAKEFDAIYRIDGKIIHYMSEVSGTERGSRKKILYLEECGPGVSDCVPVDDSSVRNHYIGKIDSLNKANALSGKSTMDGLENAETITIRDLQEAGALSY